MPDHSYRKSAAKSNLQIAFCRTIEVFCTTATQSLPAAHVSSTDSRR